MIVSLENLQYYKKCATHLKLSKGIPTQVRKLHFNFKKASANLKGFRAKKLKKD